MTTTQAALLEALTRCVAGIEHLDELARQWEPDHSSGADRHGWVLARDAKDDAKKLIQAAALRAADAAQPEPVAWAIFTGDGNARLWSTLQPHVQRLADAEGLTVTPLYAASPQPAPIAAQADDAEVQRVFDLLPTALRAHPGIKALRDAKVRAAQAGPALVPLTDDVLLKIAREHAGTTIKLTRDVGPYEVTEPTHVYRLIARAIERAHGIGAPESTRPADASISGQRGDVVLTDAQREAAKQVIASLEATVKHMLENAQALRKYPDYEQEARARELAACSVEGVLRLWQLDQWIAEAGIKRKALAAAPQAPAEQQCACGDRPASQCPGEWEPGCDLGANEKHARVAPAEPAAQAVGKPLMLRGIGRINGDGWKDTTRIGEVVYVWNFKKPAPYAPGQFPRLGHETWTASTDQYDFEPVPNDDLPEVVDATIEELRAELADLKRNDGATPAAREAGTTAGN